MQPMHLPSLSRVQSVMELSLHRCGGCAVGGSAAEAEEGQGRQETWACSVAIVQWQGAQQIIPICLVPEHACPKQCCHISAHISTCPPVLAGSTFKHGAGIALGALGGATIAAGALQLLLAANMKASSVPFSCKRQAEWDSAQLLVTGRRLVQCQLLACTRLSRACQPTRCTASPLHAFAVHQSHHPCASFAGLAILSRHLASLNGRLRCEKGGARPVGRHTTRWTADEAAHTTLCLQGCFVQAAAEAGCCSLGFQPACTTLRPPAHLQARPCFCFVVTI